MSVTTLDTKNTKGGLIKMTNKKTTKKENKKLRKYRMDAGYTIYSLGDRLGVDRSTISNWENGKKFPRPDKVMELEDLFGVSYRELFENLTEEEIRELDRRRYKIQD